MTEQAAGGAGRGGPRAPRPLFIGRVFGVPLYLGPSWLLVAAFVTAAFGGLFVDAVDGIGATAGYLLALAYAVLVAVSVLLHELGHVGVARMFRLRVRRVVIFLLGGASEIEPEPQRPREELLVAAAGPLVSAALAGVAWALRGQVADRTAISVELDLLLWSNLSIAVFNALPGLPLDGGRVLRAALHGCGLSGLSATRAAAWAGRVIAALVAASGFLLIRGAWTIAAVAATALLGGFLWVGATQALINARVSARLPGLGVPPLLRRASWTRPDVSVSEALRQAGSDGARAIVVLDGADRPQAVVDETRLAGVPVDQRAWTPIAAVAEPTDPSAAIPISLTGAELLDACRRHPAAAYVVVDDGRPVGVLAAADLRAELERPRRREPVG